MWRTRILMLLTIVISVGCSKSSQTAEAKPEVPQKTEPAPTPSPQLMKLFGSALNASEVQKASSSSHFFYLRPARQPGPVLYVDGRAGALGDLIGTHEFYAWEKPADGEFVPDIEIEFTGPEYWQVKNSGGSEHSVSVLIDRANTLLEVRVEGEAEGRASYEPGAEKLNSLLNTMGVGRVTSP